MEIINSKQFDQNPTLTETVEPDSNLKNMLVEYVGEKLNPENSEMQYFRKVKEESDS